MFPVYKGLSTLFLCPCIEDLGAYSFGSNHYACVGRHSTNLKIGLEFHTAGSRLLIFHKYGMPKYMNLILTFDLH